MTEWISVKDELPPPYLYVLVFATTQGTNEPRPVTLARLPCDDSKWEFLCEYQGEDGCGAWLDIEYPVRQHDITHWMPVPPPPKDAP